GLGMNAKEDKFKSQFKDAKVGQYSLSKRNISGDTEIDAISSATITTTAVTRSVNAGLKVAAEVLYETMNLIDN
ncbi:MAG: FMN-binding protein, partial [Lachnospiraceae bacterium]|nr:FMN-binding protein [Lachnospiraceae bacterium]